MSTAYFNGEFVDKASIAISPDDRGFLFADGLYEVIRAYDGQLFTAKEHLARLNRGTAFLRLPVQDFNYLAEVSAKLLQENNLSGDATVYIQVTRGAAPRKHQFPAESLPLTVYADAKPFDNAANLINLEKGIKAITVPDQRWARCDLKTTSLTANVLANQQAVEAGAKEALFVRDGVVLEGSHTNFMGVKDGRIVTAPANNTILHGITRKVILDICQANEIPLVLEPIFFQELASLEEAFICGTTTEVMPVTAINGKSVGEGVPGPMTRKLQELYRKVSGQI